MEACGLAGGLARYNRLVRLVAVTLGGVALIGLCGCGAAKSRATDYSVPQVEAAFKAQGLQLRQARFGPATGVVRLRHPGIEVDVVSISARWSTITSGSERESDLHNLVVQWEPRFDQSVQAALRRLRSHV
jgi:hypothetical protein